MKVIATEPQRTQRAQRNKKSQDDDPGSFSASSVFSVATVSLSLFFRGFGEFDGGFGMALEERGVGRRLLQPGTQIVDIGQTLSFLQGPNHGAESLHQGLDIFPGRT